MRLKCVLVVLALICAATPSSAGVIAIAGSVFPNSNSADSGFVSASKSATETNPFGPADGSSAYAYVNESFGTGPYSFGLASAPLTMGLSATAIGGAKQVDADAEVRVRKTFSVQSRDGSSLFVDPFVGVPLMTFRMEVDGMFRSQLTVTSFTGDRKTDVPTGYGFMVIDNRVNVFTADNAYDFDSDNDGNPRDPVFNPYRCLDSDGYGVDGSDPFRCDPYVDNPSYQQFQTDTGLLTWNDNPYVNSRRAPGLSTVGVVRPGPDYYNFYERPSDDESIGWSIDVAGNPAYTRRPYVDIYAPVVNGIGILDFSVRVGATAPALETVTADFSNTISLVDFGVGRGGTGGISNPDLFSERYELVFLDESNPIAPVPEPSSLAVFGIGLIGIGAAAVKRRRFGPKYSSRTSESGKLIAE